MNPTTGMFESTAVTYNAVTGTWDAPAPAVDPAADVAVDATVAVDPLAVGYINL